MCFVIIMFLTSIVHKMGACGNIKCIQYACASFAHKVAINMRLLFHVYYVLNNCSISYKGCWNYEKHIQYAFANLEKC